MGAPVGEQLGGAPLDSSGVGAEVVQQPHAHVSSPSSSSSSAAAAAAAAAAEEEETLQQKAEWEVEVNQEHLVGPPIPLIDLVPEFIQGSNASEKILFLAGQKQQQQQQQQQQQGGGVARVRRIRRDGCCFYRSYLFGVFECLLLNKHKLQQFREKVDSEIVPKMEATGYTKDSIEEFVDEVHAALDKLSSPTASLADLEEIFNDSSSSNYLVVFARLTTASELKSREEHYQPFLEAADSVSSFCSREVEPMWVAANEPQIFALSSSLGVSVEVFYVDQSPAKQPVRHVFPAETEGPSVQLLYRPGHYDLLYLASRS